MAVSRARTAIEHRVLTAYGFVSCNDYAGREPPIVMVHGFLDDSRIYDRLVAELTGRRVITLDFVGYGRSGRQVLRATGEGQRESELAAVIKHLDLRRPVLVGHDSGGPVVVNVAMGRGQQVRALVLLNTFYGDAPTLVFPEMIRLFADGEFTALVDALMINPEVRDWLVDYTEKRLSRGSSGTVGVRAPVVLKHLREHKYALHAMPAARAWTSELMADLRRQNTRIWGGDLRRLQTPALLAFGAEDRYFNVDVGEHVQALLGNAVSYEVEGAAHWPQWDQPARVASLILSEAS